MQRRPVIAGLAALLVAPAFVIAPASAAILFTCDSVTGSAVFTPGLVHDKRAQSLSSGPTAPAGPADITLASTSDSGVNSNAAFTADPSLSADGARVAFWSQSTNLDPGDTDALWDVYVKNLITGDVTLASTSDTGVKGNGDSGDLAPVPLSADGTKVAFTSRATNLDPADTDTVEDVYVKDLITGEVTLASTTPTGVKSNGLSHSSSLSPDGTRVAFSTEATNLPGDTNGFYDVYVKDLETGALTLVSASDLGVQGNSHSVGGRLFADGTKVAFTSRAMNLDPADTDGWIDVYVKDLETADITLLSTSSSGVKGNNHSDWVSTSSDGSRVAFQSMATNLDPADTDTFADIYVKNPSTGDLALASTSDAGVKGDDDSAIPSISADGSKVAFQSAASLDPGDTVRPSYAANDVYVKDLDTGNITLASTSDTGVNGSDNSYGPSLSSDGTAVAFYSGASLEPSDTDSGFDIYVKELPTAPTSIEIAGCSNAQSGTASLVELASYAPRPLGCPASLGGAGSNDYPDLTPVLLGSNPSLRIHWASGPDSFGVAKMKMGITSTQWRAVLAIQASPGHDTPATNQYLPVSGSGLTKTKLKGRIDWSALDSFNCTSGTADPLSWLDLVNNGGFIVKNA